MVYNGVNSWLRQLTCSNLFLYKIWFYTYRKFKGGVVRLPSNDDNFYFDGYPRSGNTFFVHFFIKIYPTKKFAHHLHTIAALKIAIDKQLPIFIIIREPKDAVASNLFRKVIGRKLTSNRELIEKSLIAYYNYYKFVYDNISCLNILSFNSCIANEVLTVKKVAKVVGFETKSDMHLRESLENFKTFMNQKEKEKDSYASSLPNKERAQFKKMYINEILNSPFYSTTKEIYNKLIKYDLLSK